MSHDPAIESGFFQESFKSPEKNRVPGAFPCRCPIECLTLERMPKPHEGWILEAKKALETSKSVTEAASKLGIASRTLRNRFQLAGLGPPHYFVYTAHLPVGHRLRGNSTLVDHAGNTIEQWIKTERDSDDPPKFQPVPDGHLVSKVSTLLDGQGAVRAQWVQAPQDKVREWEQFWTACENAAERYKGLAEPTGYPLLPDADTDSELLTIVPLGDPHVGMLSWARETGEDFDLKIAETDLYRTVDLLLARSPASRIGVLANVGDFFHAEDDAQRTPKGGNKLDVDTRAMKVTEIGFNLMRRMVDRMLTHHETVQVVNVPGNHDPKMARMLNIWCKAVYEREPRVTVLDNANPFIYLKHGKNFFGFAHGEDVKPAALPGLMASDRPEDWGAAQYRLWITGHVHHQQRFEFPGCGVETFRTLAAKDYWHHANGYRAGRSLSAITFHKEFGEITRSTVDLKLARS